MKLRTLFATLLLPILLVGCATTGESGLAGEDDDGRPEDSVSDDMNYFRNLADYLKQVPGVNIMGNGDNISVNVRGATSINSGTQPLFVIDGHAVGNNYSQANNMVNPRDIDYVRVLKGPDAAIYGVRGGNGVILIYTRK